MSARIFIDSNVLLYAVGSDHSWRRACADLVERITLGDVEAHGSVEVIQEFLFHRMRRAGRALAIRQADRIADVISLHAFDESVWRGARNLVETTTIRGRDAVHAATALAHGFSEIVTVDGAFAAVPGLTPVRPEGF